MRVEAHHLEQFCHPALDARSLPMQQARNSGDIAAHRHVGEEPHLWMAYPI